MRNGHTLACAMLVAAIATAIPSGQARAQDAASAPQAETVTITLEEAIRRAEASEPGYAAAKADSRSAQLDRSIAAAGLLPIARSFSQGIYVQPNGLHAESGEGVASAPDPKFVAADARPREYMAQGVVDETLGMAGIASVRRANAAAAQAEAQLEVERRGLIAAVTGLFYGLYAADAKLSVARRALLEAQDFTTLTTEREQARETAHADVVKAQLVEQQRERDLSDATVAAEKARLELGVLLFSDPETPYTLGVGAAPSLASRADVNAAAARNNPQLKAALATVGVSDADVMAARAAYLPNVLLNVAYGIDANEFAANGPLLPDGARASNLGYSASVTVNLPVWDWLATEHKVKQSEIRRDAAKVALSATQRQLIARLDVTYSEAAAARDQLASLDASVSTAAEALKLTKLRYQGGEGTVLEVVDAQNAYLLAENAREDGRARYEMALADLQTLTGTM